jgi:UTP--glucose-1-phosphate uridylyltransferase
LPGIDGEIQLFEAINSLVLSHGVEAVHLRGKRFDCGSVNGYLEAIIYKAKEECII